MEVDSRDNSHYIKTSLELENLLHKHFQHRQESKKVLKERLRAAELEIATLRQSLITLSEDLKAERTRCETLQTSIEYTERCHATEVIQCDKMLEAKKSDLEAQARLLMLKNEECERRMQGLQEQSEDILMRRKKLESHQSFFESGIVHAQRQVEAEKLRAQRMKEQAEKFLNEARVSAAATNRRRDELECLYNTEIKIFELEREEFVGRMNIVRQEITSVAYLISSRLAYVPIIESRACERIRLSERDLSSKREVLEIREKEVILRHQREEEEINEERKRVCIARETLRKEYSVILENVRLLGDEDSVEPELSQLVKLRNLEQLFTSSLDDYPKKLEKF